MLKLSCTADDMIPLAKACDFKDSRGDGVDLWKESERAELRAELDAACLHLSCNRTVRRATCVSPPRFRR
jgi:hypothetical protein